MDRDAPEPLGFGNCGSPDGTRCPYYEHGSVLVCWSCALRDITRPPENGCDVCSRPLPPGEDGPVCSNWLCQGKSKRYFQRAYAIGLKQGSLDTVLVDYKEHHGWAPVLARILVGWLDEQLSTGREWDLVTSMPHAAGEHGRNYTPGHLVLRLAHDEAPYYPLDTGQPRPAIVKTRETPSATGQSARERERLARSELYPALEVPDPQRIKDRRLLVIDDFLTTGHSINMVARKLTEAGARSVEVLVFARSV